MEEIRRQDISTLIVVDRKSTRLNSSHSQISYAVFCLKKKKENRTPPATSLATKPRLHSPTKRHPPYVGLRRRQETRAHPTAPRRHAHHSAVVPPGDVS